MKIHAVSNKATHEEIEIICAIRQIVHVDSGFFVNIKTFHVIRNYIYDGIHT